MPKEARVVDQEAGQWEEAQAAREAARWEAAQVGQEVVEWEGVRVARLQTTPCLIVDAVQEALNTAPQQDAKTRAEQIAEPWAAAAVTAQWAVIRSPQGPEALARPPAAAR